ncbi:hypothetical protein ACER0C_030298 [Sarotherodon galilaeus]
MQPPADSEGLTCNRMNGYCAEQEPSPPLYWEFVETVLWLEKCKWLREVDGGLGRQLARCRTLWKPKKGVFVFVFFKANITVSVTGGGERGGERLQLQEDLGVRLFLRLGEKQFLL